MTILNTKEPQLRTAKLWLSFAHEQNGQDFEGCNETAWLFSFNPPVYSGWNGRKLGQDSLFKVVS
jgi:hypothetical protein